MIRVVLALLVLFGGALLGSGLHFLYWRAMEEATVSMLFGAVIAGLGLSLIADVDE